MRINSLRRHNSKCIIPENATIIKTSITALYLFIRGTDTSLFSKPMQHSYAKLGALEQSNRIPSKDKFRMMPCKTFIMCGACPYHERCMYAVST